MTSTVARYVLIALGVATLPLVVATGWAVVLSFRRSWRRAQRMARTSFGVSILILVFAWFAIPMLVVWNAGIEGDGTDPSGKARALAEAISEGMNYTALAFVSAPIVLATWLVASWRARKDEAGPP